MSRKKGPQARYATREQAEIGGRLALLTHGKALRMLAEHDRRDGAEADPADGAPNDRHLQERADWERERCR